MCTCTAGQDEFIGPGMVRFGHKAGDLCLLKVSQPLEIRSSALHYCGRGAPGGGPNAEEQAFCLDQCLYLSARLLHYIEVLNHLLIYTSGYGSIPSLFQVLDVFHTFPQKIYQQ